MKRKKPNMIKLHSNGEDVARARDWISLSLKSAYVLCLFTCARTTSEVTHHQHWSYCGDSYQTRFDSKKAPREVNNQLHLNLRPRSLQACVCVSMWVVERKRWKKTRKTERERHRVRERERARPQWKTEEVLLGAERVVFSLSVYHSRLSLCWLMTFRCSETFPCCLRKGK